MNASNTDNSDFEGMEEIQCPPATEHASRLHLKLYLNCLLPGLLPDMCIALALENRDLKADAGDDNEGNCRAVIPRVDVLHRAACFLTMLGDRDGCRSTEDDHVASLKVESAVLSALDDMVAQGVLFCREHEDTMPSIRGLSGTKMVMVEVLDSEYIAALAGGGGYVIEGVPS
jgi:hypothetical protein